MLTAAQLEARVWTLGSSEIAAVAGLSRFATGLNVWLTKGEQAERRPPEHHSSEQTELGDDLEPVIGRRAHRKIGKGELERAQETIVHPSLSWASATPDFWVRAMPAWRRILETKNVGHTMVRDWESGVPDYVDCQVQWQLGVCGLARGYVGAMLGGREVVVHEIEADADYFAGLLDIGETFWKRHVLGGEPPAVDGSKMAARYLTERFPRHTQPLKVADDEAHELAGLLRAARAQAAEATERAKLAEHRLKAWLGSAEGVETAEGKITWRASKDRLVTDWQQVAEELGAEVDSDVVAAAVARNTATKPGSRRFVVPRSWGK